MTPNEYKALLKLDLNEIARQLALCPSLSNFLKKDWVETVATHIDMMAVDPAIVSAAQQLFRILHGEQGLTLKIEDGLALMEPIARKDGKLKSFQEIGERLALKSLNQSIQIESTIFEILILRGLIRAAAQTAIKIELYPNVGDGKSNIEARVWIDRRWCNIEAKILGYPRNMPSTKGNRVFSGSAENTMVPIRRALFEKTGTGKQLACVPSGESSVVFLAQNENIHDRSLAQIAAHDFLDSEPSALSAVLLFGSPFCRTTPDLIASHEATASLTSIERAFLNGIHDQISHLNPPRQAI